MYSYKFFQRLISEAYDILSKNENWSYEEFIDSLDEKHKAAVLVGDFDSKVKKDGFDQWYWNKYSGKVKAEALLRVLNEFVKDTKPGAGKGVIALIEIYTKESLYDVCDYAVQEQLLTKIYLKIRDCFIERFSEWLIKKYGNVE